MLKRILAVFLLGAMIIFVSSAYGAYPAGQTPKTGDRITIGANAWHPENTGHTGTVMRVDTTAKQVEVKVDNPAGGARRAVQWYLWSEVTPIGATPTPTPSPTPSPSPTPTPSPSPTPTPSPSPT